MNNMEYTTEWLDNLLRQYQYLLIVDIEHTCFVDNSLPANEREIIEIGALMVCAKSLLVIDEFECIVKPVQHPNLSDFCVELTGIQQEDVDKANGFRAAFNEFVSWQKKYEGCLFCSWGAYDSVQLKLDCVRHNIEPLDIKLALNLKKAFAKTQKIKPRVGMKRALDLAGFPLQGSHHRGLDDAKNIARLLPFILGSKSIDRNQF